MLHNCADHLQESRKTVPLVCCHCHPRSVNYKETDEVDEEFHY